jgi:hypothetical protein
VEIIKKQVIVLNRLNFDDYLKLKNALTNDDDSKSKQGNYFTKKRKLIKLKRITKYGTTLQHAVLISEWNEDIKRNFALLSACIFD